MIQLISEFQVPHKNKRGCTIKPNYDTPSFFMMGCGAGGIRTHVQTGKPYAFYTFIPAFGFRATARPGPPTGALASKNSSCCRGPTRLFPIYLHRLTLRFGTTSLERCLVPSSDDGIKPVIYCTSIRQRERSCFRQLNLCSLRLWS